MVKISGAPYLVVFLGARSITRNGESLILEGDVDVLLLEARQLDGKGVRVLVLDQVHLGDKRADRSVLASSAAAGTIDVFKEATEVGEVRRVPVGERHVRRGRQVGRRKGMRK